MRILEDIMDNMDVIQTSGLEELTPDEMLQSNVKFEKSDYSIIMMVEFFNFEHSEIIKVLENLNDVLSVSSQISSHSYFYIPEKYELGTPRKYEHRCAFVGLNFNSCTYRNALRLLNAINDCTQRKYVMNKTFITLKFFDSKTHDDFPDTSGHYLSKFSFKYSIRDQIVNADWAPKCYHNLISLCELICGYMDEKKFRDALSWMEKKYNDDFDKKWNKNMSENPGRTS